MTLPSPSSRSRVDRNTPPNSRTIHSSRRANTNRKYRRRFDQFRNSGHAATGNRRELEEWQSGLEVEALDKRIVQIEDNALREREAKSVVPRIGNLASDKPDGVWRIGYCQLNNMSGSDTRRRKIKDMQRIIQDFELDGMTMCELGVNWSSGRGHSLKSWCSPYFSHDIRCATAHNTHSPRISLGQPGGTGILLTPTLFEYARATDIDHRGLGRWTSVLLSHTPEHTTRLVVAYCPCTSSSDTGLKTVYRQHLNYIQNNDLGRTPYQLFFDDLILQLKQWRSNNERLILCIDLNEHSLTGKIARRISSDDIQLHESTHTSWPEGKQPHTYIDGSKPIDGIFSTPDIEVTNSLLLSFHESAGDHRTMILEFTTASSIGRFQGKIVRPSSRRLTLRQPGAIQSYNNSIHSQFNIHRIPERLATLLAESQLYNFPPPTTFQSKCNITHEQIAQIRLSAESTCRKILKPALEFSPTVQFWYDRAHAYILLIKIKSGVARKYTDISRAMRFAARKKITNPRSLTLEQCQDGLTACKIRQKELRRTSTSLRRQFTQSIVSRATASGDVNRARVMKERMQRERNSSIWKRINKVTRPSRGRACREVQRDIDGRIHTFTTKASVEYHIQQECSSRFQLGHSAPIASTLLGYELQYLQNQELAYSILMGTYEIPPHLDQATQLVLREIGKLGKAVLHGTSPIDIVITGDDYTQYWRHINDRTSSSPSGIHITHYKASALDPVLATQFATQMNLIIRSGVHPLRWGNALQVMLEKVAGICLVDKLRSIQLYEADLNWFMKFIFNDIALSKLENTGLLPEEHYSNKGSTSEDACLEKTLTFDISRQSRSPMATISVDAAQCYDRVHPTLMSLIWLALTNHPHSVIILLHVLQQMKIFTRTGFGDSSTYFGGPDDIPMCGLGQGSKAAPASWLQLSSMIVNAYKSQSCASSIQDPITGKITQSVGCMFVDDTDLYCMSPLLHTVILVVLQAQVCVSLWSRLLNSTGGSIKGSKSFWYLIDYQCTRGEWSYTTYDDDSGHNLYLSEPSGNMSRLERKLPTDAVKTLGVYHSPVGDHAEHLRQLSTKAADWLNKIRNGHLPSSYVLLSYYHQLWPGLRYGLGTLSNSYSAADACLIKFDYALLPYIGVNRHIKKEWRTLHSAYGGVGLLSLPIEQLICRSNLLLQHYNTSSIIGNKITCSFHLLQLQIGTNGNPLLLSYKTYGHLAPNSWLCCYWEAIDKFPIRLHLNYDPIPFPRQFDDTIMSFLQQHLNTAPLRTSINRVRCYLHLLFLSDMSTADGKFIDQELLRVSAQPLQSKYSFPPENPTRDDWLIWIGVWKKALGCRHALPHSLGDWLHPSHVQWRWFFDSSTDSIVEVVGDCIHTFTTDRTQRSRTRSGGAYSLTNTTTKVDTVNLHPASCSIIPSRLNEYRVRLRNVGPTLSLPNKLPSSFWDILENFGGNWMWQHMHLECDTSVEWFLAALSHGSLVWVTDGSHNPKCAPDISGAGWIVKDCTTNRRWACSFFEISRHANSYRAELLGLYSIHVFILALSTYFTALQSSTVKLRCDNKGALRTSSRRHKRIRPSSKCADILRCLRSVHDKLQHIHIHYGYVAAHMDDILHWNDLTLEQQLNVQCDSLAKHAVSTATKCWQTGTHLPDTNLLPLEHCALYANNNKLSSDILHPLRFECSKIKAKEFLCTQRGWTMDQFDSVDWDSIDDALSKKTTGFKIWLAKQHSNFCATRSQLHRYNESDNDKCPSCLSASENADHLCRCPNEERTQLLRDNTAELELWMAQSNNTHHELLYWIPHYILCRGQVNFVDLGPMSPTMYDIALSQDSIGWRNFMEGRISTKITLLQKSHLLLSGSRLSTKSWMSTFISKLLHITHSQWIFRNFTLHDKAMGYLRLKECTEAAVQIDELMQTKPSAIPRESHFLLEFDQERLLDADSDTQQYWIAAFEAALAAKHNSQPTVSPPASQLQQSRHKASRSIAQIRRDVAQCHPPTHWVVSPTAVAGAKPASPRPNPHHIQLTLPSNKKRKPD